MSSKLACIHDVGNNAELDLDAYHGGVIFGPCVQITITYRSEANSMWVGLDLAKARSLWMALGGWIARHGG